MGVYELSGAGSLKTPRTVYSSMNAGNQYGAMVPIASYTANGTSNFFSFTSIPQTYQDLFFVINGRSAFSSATAQVYTYLNSDGSALYSRTRLYGNGSAAASDRTSNDTAAYIAEIPGASATSGIFGSGVMHILNYANTSTFKTVLIRSAVDLNGSGFTHLWVNTYRSTNAIRGFDIFNSGASNFTSGTTVTLYGIRAVSS